MGTRHPHPSGTRRRLCVFGAVAVAAACAALGAAARGGADASAGTATVTVNIRDALRLTPRDASTWARVTSTPAGIDCPGACSATFALRTRVVLMLRPKPGYVLDGWVVNRGLGMCQARRACAFDVSADTVVEAGIQPEATLNALPDGAGKLVFDRVERGRPRATCEGFVSKPAADWRSCRQRYAAGTRVTARAIVDSSVPGASFLGWSHPRCPGRRPTCTVTLRRGALDLYASFAPVFLRIQAGSWRSFGIDPPRPRCAMRSDPRRPWAPRTCLLAYPPDTVVRLTAPIGMTAGWRGTCAPGARSVCVVRMYEDRYVVAGARAPGVSDGGIGERIRLVYDGPRGGSLLIRSLTLDERASACRRTCTRTNFQRGELVSIRARSGRGATFVRWSDNGRRAPFRKLRIGTVKGVRATFRHR